MKIKRLHNKGFTIIELMMATTVFSVVLLVITFGLLSIGRTYYKGITAARTQETARSILDEITNAIQFGGGDIIAPAQAGEGTPGFYCVGSRRFSYVRDRQLTDGAVGAGQSRHVMVVDDVGSCSASTGPTALSGNLTAGQRELMNTRMRLAVLTINRVGTTDLYNVTVRVVSGDDNQLIDTNTDNILDTCSSERSASQSCSASELTTVVQKRVK